MGSDAESAEATFSLNLEGNVADKSKEDASALEDLRSMIHGATDNLREMQAAQRSLRGSTSDVIAARTQLEAKIDAERNSISAANLSLLKQGVTYEKLAAAEKKARIEQTKLNAKKEAQDIALMRDRTAGMEKTLRSVGGPLADAADGFSTLRESVGKAGLGMGLLVGGAAAVVLAMVAITGALIAGVFAFGKWVIGAADALRTMNLMREAATGNAEAAHNLGTHIDELSAKLSTPKEKLNELAIELRRKNPYLSGPELINTFNLVGQAADALGDEVGNTFKEIATRGQRFQRLSLTPTELIGTGIKFQDVAAEISKSMKVSMAEAQSALVNGGVKLDGGLKALRATIEKRFASINARKMLSIPVMTEKIHEALDALTRDVHLEPLNEGFGKMLRYLSDSTVSGKALHDVVTGFGNEIVKDVTSAGPALKGFYKGLIIGSLDVGIAFFRLRNSLADTFGPAAKDVDLFKVALMLAEAPLKGLAFILDQMAVSVKILKGAASLVGIEIGGRPMTSFHRDGADAGAAYARGLTDGVLGGMPAVNDAVNAAALSMPKQTAKTLKIHSPSKIGKDQGVEWPAGLAAGVKSGIPDVEDAAAGAAGVMPRTAAPGLPPPSAGGGGGSRGSVTIGQIVLKFDSKTSGAEAQKQASSPSFVAELTKALEEALKSVGVPIQAVPNE